MNGAGIVLHESEGTDEPQGENEPAVNRGSTTADPAESIGQSESFLIQAGSQSLNMLDVLNKPETKGQAGGKIDTNLNHSDCK